MAPEVLMGEYDEKCDIWSIGVVLYMILTGYPPFNGDNELEIINTVKRGIYDKKSCEYYKLSEDAKNFISLLLKYNPSERVSASKALDHKFIKYYEETEEDGVLVNKCLMALVDFNIKQKL